MTSVTQLKYRPLSDSEIVGLLDGQTVVRKYNELDRFSSIDELLAPYGNCVILLETAKNFGHWICIKRTGKMVSFFDSYGGFPDNQKHYINEDFLEKSGQSYNKICELLYKASFSSLVEFSNRKLQNIKNSKVATCGYWCALFIKSGMTVDEFYKYIDSFHVKDKDSLVVSLIAGEIPQPKRRRVV